MDGKKLTEAADIAAYVEAEWERRAAALPKDTKPLFIQLTASKALGEAAKVRLIWHEEPDLPSPERG
jgi:hypothetical protein